MLYSILVAFICYYAIKFIIGILVNSMAFTVTLIILAVACLVGFCLTRKANRLLHRFLLGMSLWFIAFFIGYWIVHPIVPGAVWVTLLSVLCCLILYIATRRYFFRRYIKREDGTKPAPPLKKEWLRWPCALLL